MDDFIVYVRKNTIWDILKTFIVKHFFPMRCHCCDCIDCQLGDLDREYWYCPHLKADICNICCIYDSLDPNWDWDECNLCIHDIDRERGLMEDSV